MTKKEKFIQEVKHQLNIDLLNDKEEVFNQKRNVLYTKVEKINNYNNLIRYLNNHHVNYCCHFQGCIWIYL